MYGCKALAGLPSLSCTANVKFIAFWHVRDLEDND
jgi:hypothetical protein